MDKSIAKIIEIEIIDESRKGVPSLFTYITKNYQTNQEYPYLYR